MINTVAKLKKILLIVGDLFILYFSLWLVLLVRYGQVETERWQQHFLPFSIIFAVWLIIFYINNLYELKTARNSLDFYAIILKSLLWCASLAVAFFYLLKIGIAPKTNLALQLIFFSLLFVFWRNLFNLLAKTKALANNVLIIGLTSATIQLIKELTDKPQHGLRLVAVFNENPDLLSPELENEVRQQGLKIISPDVSLLDTVIDEKISIIVSALDLHNHPNLLGIIFRCLSLKITFFDLPEFLEKITNKVPVNAIGQIWFLENFKEEKKKMYEISKRIFDLLGALILFIITLPFLPLIFLVVKLNSHGPFLFRQIRLGKSGHRFLAIKIRSMHRNAEINGPQWAQKNDPRVTKSGRFMRKTRIDEIPQLINIIRGEMSFIGPRPERPEFVEKLEQKIPFYRERNLVKPGLTGWAQVNFPYGSSEEDALEKLQYDLYYIKNRSFILDLSIVLKTIKIVLAGGGQ
jgi:exopolysaccharide biosynthesis polyprenyl glycosylphosphotransferase